MSRFADFKRFSISTIALGGVAVLAAYTQGAGGACAADPVPGLNISVVDTAGIAGNVVNVKFVVRDGIWGDSINSSARNVTSFSTAFDRPGTYAITGTGTAVRTFAIAGIVVQTERLPRACA